MNSSVKKYTLFALKLIIIIASGYYVGLFIYIGLSRLSFPITFDWVEGPILVQINRVLLGQKLFVEPGAAYVPLVYAPLYFYVAAGFAKLFGFSLASSRLLSILASCGCTLIIFLVTRRETGSRFFGVVSAGLFAATNGIVWTWFGFAKVDMLGIFFSLLGLFFLVRADTPGALLAALFFALSFFTKQSAVIIVIPAFIFYFLVNRKSALLSMAATAFLTLAGFLVLNYDSNGWYYFYNFTLPSYHRLDTSPERITYVVTSILKPVLVFIGVVFISILVDLKKFFQDGSYFFFSGLAGCTLVLAIISALSIGSTRNAFIPAYALMSIVFGLGLWSAQNKIETILSANLRFICSFLLLILCLLQFSFLQYNPREYIPSTQDFKRANLLIKNLQNTAGNFFIPSQNYLALVVGKKVYFHEAPLGEFTGWYGRSLPEWPGIQKEIRAIVQSGETGTVFLTSPQHVWMKSSCEKEEVLRSQSKYVPTLYKMKCN